MARKKTTQNPPDDSVPNNLGIYAPEKFVSRVNTPWDGSGAWVGQHHGVLIANPKMASWVDSDLVRREKECVALLDANMLGPESHDRLVTLIAHAKAVNDSACKEGRERLTVEEQTVFDADLAEIKKIKATRPKRPSEDAPENVKDAWLFLQTLYQFRDHCRTSDLPAAVISAAELGRITARMDTRWAEPFVIQEQKRKLGVDQAKTDRQQAAIAHYHRQRKLHPSSKKETLVDLVVKAMIADGEKLGKRTAYKYLNGLD
ncbi:MAG TPA: hypothetical protein VGJ26_02850 [Pirellulales bacterium]|jgi:hypothetical protein